MSLQQKTPETDGRKAVASSAAGDRAMGEAPTPPMVLRVGGMFRAKHGGVLIQKETTTNLC